MNIGGGLNLYRVELSEEGSNPKTWLYRKWVSADSAGAACVKALDWAKTAHQSQTLQVYNVTFEGYVL